MTNITPSNIRERFPFFTSNSATCYLDSAATTQKPQEVIAAVVAHLSSSANPGRGSYKLASQLEQKVYAARTNVAQFLNAQSADEIIFTSGATESLNLVALAWGQHNLTDGDEIAYCPSDHISTILPWLQLQSALKKNGIHIKLVPFELSAQGTLEIATVLASITSKTRLIAITHVHNIYGHTFDIEILKRLLPTQVLISLDVSQSAGHTQIDVQTLGVDFVSFSGHKLFTPEGIGVLWVRSGIHSTLRSLRTNSTHFTTLHSTAINHPPLAHLLEAGTQNTTGILGLNAAITFINSIGIEIIESHVQALTNLLVAKLRNISGVVLLPCAHLVQKTKTHSIVPFTIAGISTQEAGFILDQYNVNVRTGTQCNAIKDSSVDVIRASLHVYNNEKDINYFVDTIAHLTQEIKSL